MAVVLRSFLGLALTLGLLAFANAQDRYADVSGKHWAQQALGQLKKDGLLVGYPNGRFRGNAPATRYELVEAVHALYWYEVNVTAGLDEQLQPRDRAPSPEYEWLRAIEAMQRDVDKMKSLRNDIGDAGKTVSALADQLASVRGRVAKVKKRLEGLAKRVRVLELRPNR